jgi:hypothetical protein
VWFFQIRVLWLYEPLYRTIIHFVIFPLITKATRITAITDHTETLTELNDSINGIVFSDISDHLPIVHVFNTNIFGKNRNANEATVTYQRVYSETQ